MRINFFIRNTYLFQQKLIIKIQINLNICERIEYIGIGFTFYISKLK